MIIFLAKSRADWEMLDEPLLVRSWLPLQLCLQAGKEMKNALGIGHFIETKTNETHSFKMFYRAAFA